MEQWKDVNGYEGYYQVSNTGKVMRTKVSCISEPRILTPMDNGACFTVVLSKGGKRTKYKVHTLVAKHFIDNPNDYQYINHIDGNYRNNVVDNLEWCTLRHNAAHGMGRPIELLFGSIWKSFPSVSSAARFLGCHEANLYYYAKNNVPTKDGIYVRFADELKESYRTSGATVLNQ